MTCTNCDHDLEACTCSDLPERWKAIKASEYIMIGADYALRIQAQADAIEKARKS